MGLASMFLGDQNPFSQWVGGHQNFLNTIGSGLMQGQNLQHGLQIAGQNAPQAKQLDLQQAEKMKAEALKTAQSNYTLKLFQDKGFSDLVDLANAGAPMGELMQEYFKRIQPAAPEPVKGVEVNNRLVNPYTGDVLADFSDPTGANGASDETFFGTPIPVTNKDGSVGYVQMGNKGTVRPLQLPEGQNWATRTRTVDTGTEYIIQDAFGTEVGRVPKNVYDEAALRAAGATQGQNVGQAQFDLNGADLTLRRALDAVNVIRNNKQGIDEQFGSILFVPQQMTPAWPGSKKAILQNDVSRASGIAFLEARQMLKGGGAITDFESQKAETAFANIQLALEKGDRESFLRALDDFESAVTDGYKKLVQRAQSMPGYGGEVVIPPMPDVTPPGAITNPNYPGVVIRQKN